MTTSVNAGYPLKKEYSWHKRGPAGPGRTDYSGSPAASCCRTARCSSLRRHDSNSG